MADVTFKPLGNRIVVEPMEDDAQMSAGGIYIPDTAKEKPQEGTVVAVGPGKLTDDGKRVPWSSRWATLWSTPSTAGPSSETATSSTSSSEKTTFS